MTDWLMVIITAVYVVATIAICIANFKSAKATREQLDESKRQYEDKKRLEIMPCFYLKFKDENPSDNLIELDITGESDNRIDFQPFKMIIENVGKGLAKNISAVFVAELAYMQKKAVVNLPILPEHKSYSIGICFLGGIETIKEKQGISTHYCIQFEDVLGNKYQQKIELVFSCSEDELYIYKTNIFSPITI